MVNAPKHKMVSLQGKNQLIFHTQYKLFGLKFTMLLSTMFVNLAIFAICVVHISIQLIMLYRLFFRRYSCFDKYNNTIGSNLFRRPPTQYSGYGSYERSQTGQFVVFEGIRHVILLPLCQGYKTLALTLKMTLTRKNK